MRGAAVREKLSEDTDWPARFETQCADRPAGDDMEETDIGQKQWQDQMPEAAGERRTSGLKAGLFRDEETVLGDVAFVQSAMPEARMQRRARPDARSCRPGSARAGSDSCTAAFPEAVSDSESCARTGQEQVRPGRWRYAHVLGCWTCAPASPEVLLFVLPKPGDKEKSRPGCAGRV